MQIDTDCSDNVQFDCQTGATLDGTWSEFTIEEKTLYFKRKGKSINLAANISDGKKFLSDRG